jgi:BirA family biotin operon repressor/biotin-[acetyl-CoA-carboxylase] ligase
LIKENIIKKLKNKDLDIILLDSVTSTNDYLKDLAKSGKTDTTVVIAETQTKGKGTHNRTFISRKGGVYLSILLTPENSSDITKITPLTAVCVSDSIEAVSDAKTQIKWVNDVYLNGKKVAGILCESFSNPETQKVSVIVGIGVNLFRPKDDFDTEIKDIATSVFEAETQALKEDFIAILIDNFFKNFSEISSGKFIKKYKEKNLIIGKKVEFLHKNEPIIATAVGIDEDCHLIARLEDKTLVTLTSANIILI